MILYSKQKKTIYTISQKKNKKIKSIFGNGKSFIHGGRVFFKEFKEIEGLESYKKKKEDLINLDKQFVNGDLLIDGKAPKSHERKFIDGKRSIIIDGDLFEEVDSLGKTPDKETLIGKKSPNLKPTLESLKKKNRTFCLKQDPKSLNTWIIQEFKPNPIKAIMRIKIQKRNIFCTLSTKEEKLLAVTSSGILKTRKKGALVPVRGRERQSSYNIRATGFLVQKEILKYNVTQLRLHHTGNAHYKKKKDFLNCIKGFNSLQIDEINRPASRSHNGNRPKKIRRK